MLAGTHALLAVFWDEIYLNLIFIQRHFRYQTLRPRQQHRTSKQTVLTYGRATNNFDSNRRPIFYHSLIFVRPPVFDSLVCGIHTKVSIRLLSG